MFGNGIAVLVFCFCNLLVKIHAANSKFLASTSMPSVNSSAPSENASTVAPVPLPGQTEAKTSASVEEDKMCKQSCNEANFPGTAELARASMCELDYCEGCPKCAKLTGRTSSRTPAPTIDNSPATAPQMQSVSNTSGNSKEDQWCASWCHTENYPGTPELQLASMCEWDTCMGCPKCAFLTSTSRVPRAPSQRNEAKLLPVNASRPSETDKYTTTPAVAEVSSEAVVPYNALSSMFLGSLAVVVLH